MISIFDIFKIGIGPSSSHTVGPMKAAAAFADLLNAENLDTQVARIVIEVYGSLALTGIGHGTFDALLLGLEGSLPHDIPLADIPQRLERIRTQHVLKLNGREMAFNPEKDLDIRGDKVLPKHPNGLNFIAYHSDGLKLKEQIYYSVGGGFVVTDEGFAQEAQENADVPYPYKNCDELLAQCRLNQLNISEVVLANEAALAGCDEVEVRRRVAAVADVMENCIKRGLGAEGQLPGGLNVRRRAPPPRDARGARQAYERDGGEDHRLPKGHAARAILQSASHRCRHDGGARQPGDFLGASGAVMPGDSSLVRGAMTTAIHAYHLGNREYIKSP